MRLAAGLRPDPQRNFERSPGLITHSREADRFVARGDGMREAKRLGNRKGNLMSPSMSEAYRRRCLTAFY